MNKRNLKSKGLLKTIVTGVAIFTAVVANAQNVGFNVDGSIPDASAAVDIKSTNRGLLIPRMTTTQRNDIASPADGLLVFDNTTSTFWYYEGVLWEELTITSNDSDGIYDGDGTTPAGTDVTVTDYINIGVNTLFVDGANNRIGIGTNTPTDALHIVGTSGNTIRIVDGNQAANKVLTSDANGNATWQTPSSGSTEDSTRIIDQDGDTKIQVEESADEDVIRFDVAGTERWVMVGNRLESKNSNFSTYIGENAGLSHTAGAFYNIGIGSNALRNNSGGDRNSAVGLDALQNNTGSWNSAFGFSSISANTSGNFNSAFGTYSLRAITTASGNSAFGYGALANNSVGSNNVAIGFGAGGSTSGGGHVLIGFQAGETASGDNKLYIENSNSSTPLIYGDFAVDSLVINGKLTVTDTLKFIKDAAAGKVLTSDVNGVATWQTPSGGADGDGIYDGSGSLSGNTVVTGGANTLDFTTTATAGFNVNDTVFSVDGANNRIGIGTAAPTLTLDVHNNSTEGVALLRNNNIAGYSSLEIQDNTGALKTTFGYGNASSAIPFAYTFTTANTDYKFVIGAADRMFINSTSGNVGIGTITPLGALHTIGSGVNGWNYFTGNAGTSNPSVANSIGLMLGWNASGGAGESNIVWGIGGGHTPSLQFQTWDGATRSTRMTINAAGNVGIGTSTPFSPLHVSSVNANVASFTTSNAANNASIYIYNSTNGFGAALVSNSSSAIGGIQVGTPNFGSYAPVYASSFVVSSDRNVKHDIHEIEVGEYEDYLNQIRNVESATYKYNNEPIRTKNHIGVIAQTLPIEVQAETTDVPGENGKPIIGMNLADMTGLNFVGIKALDYKQTTLEAKVEQQQQEIDELKSMVQELLNK